VDFPALKNPLAFFPKMTTMKLSSIKSQKTNPRGDVDAKPWIPAGRDHSTAEFDGLIERR
jgi:hypothetical protein